MTTVELIDDRIRFEAIEAEWGSLLDASSSRSPFLSFGWLYAWWTHLAGVRQLALVTVRRDGRLVGLAPLCITRARIPYFSRWEFLGTGLAGSDYLDVLAEPRSTKEVISALHQFMRSLSAALHLDHLPNQSLTAGIAGSLTGDGWSTRSQPCGVCPYIALDGHSWDSFLAALPASHRTTIRRRLHALERKFSVQFQRVSEEPARREAVDALSAFHRERFEEDGGSTTFASQALVAFHHDATARAMAAGWLRLFTLRVDGDLAGVMYGFAFKQRFYFYQHGFAKKYRRHSIGRALVELTIREAIDERCDEFDMLYGEEAYKAFWPTVKRELVRIDAFPPHLGGQIHHHTMTAERTMRTLARRVVSIYSHAVQPS